MADGRICSMKRISARSSEATRRRVKGDAAGRRAADASARAELRVMKGGGPRLGGRRLAGIVERIRDIPVGHGQTYGDIGAKAPRLVGRILATAHLELPWHRVVRADGSIPKGKVQAELLRREGVPMRGERGDLGRARGSLSTGGGLRARPNWASRPRPPLPAR